MSGNIEPLLAGYNTGDGGSNAAVYLNDQVDDLIRQSSRTADAAERTRLLGQAMDIVNEDCPYVFLSYPNKQCTCNRAYTGFTMNSSWLWNMYFKDIVLAG